MNSLTKPLLLLACFTWTASSVLTACAGGSREFIWVQNIPPSQTVNEYIVLPGDLLSVNVFNQENMSSRARVRSDGKIALPFLGDVEVTGKSPATISKELKVKLRKYVVSPVVTVTVEERIPTSVSVLGEVARPGLYTVEESAGVLQALALAGGFTDFASRGSIYLIRRTPAQRVRFTYASLSGGERHALNYRLRAGDVLVVE